MQSLANVECRDGCQWCGQLVPLSDIQRHLDEECAKVPCSCNFREVGCRATVPRAELTAHLDSQIHDHLSVKINLVIVTLLITDVLTVACVCCLQ